MMFAVSIAAPSSPENKEQEEHDEAKDQVTPEQQQKMEEDLSKMFGDGKMPSMEELQAKMKEIFGDDYENMFGNLEDLEDDEDLGDLDLDAHDDEETEL